MNDWYKITIIDVNGNHFEESFSTEEEFGNRMLLVGLDYEAIDITATSGSNG
jgi:hypothetical protein